VAEGDLNEFVDTQQLAQDPEIEKERDVAIIFYGFMPKDFSAETVWEALEAVLPGEYPPGRNKQGYPTSNAERVTEKISKQGGAVVTLKPLSVAKKLVKTFQTYGIKCRIDTNESVTEAGPRLPDPQNYDSDWDYYNDRDAEEPKDDDADYENMIDEPSDDWFDESKQKVGNMDADAFDDALARMKKLAGAGPMKTVWDPARRVYKNVPTAQQPAQQPKK
jgi:hypothetical protein